MANGWYSRELGEVWLWRQSQKLIDAPLVWEDIRKDKPDFKVLKHFWWYAMNTDVNASVTPRPTYHADGSKGPDFYTWPPELKASLLEKHGEFPLFHFWGPLADIQSSRWIAESFCTAYDLQQPDLALCYLPHLDYDLQRYGPEGAHLQQNLKDIDACAGTVIDHVKSQGGECLVVSEYGIEAVSKGVPLNRKLREAGLLAVTTNATGELLDPGMSKAFAVCDHQIAHVYCADEHAVKEARRIMEGMAGIEKVYDREHRGEIGLDHYRSGELIAIAEAGSWFLYDYWLDDALRPDFANAIEIHKKPGYDPRELVFGKGRAFKALAKKKLGFRYNMNPVPLDPSLVKGSHGRPAVSPEKGPVCIASSKDFAKDDLQMTDLSGMIKSYFLGQ